jgi:hypothetical protein
LGDLYRFGKGVKVNLEKAVEYYKRGEKYGFQVASLKLKEMEDLLKLHSMSGEIFEEALPILNQLKEAMEIHSPTLPTKKKEEMYQYLQTLENHKSTSNLARQLLKAAIHSMQAQILCHQHPNSQEYDEEIVSHIAEACKLSELFSIDYDVITQLTERCLRMIKQQKMVEDASFALVRLRGLNTEWMIWTTESLVKTGSRRNACIFAEVERSMRRI